jgi:hypothetical protein
VGRVWQRHEQRGRPLNAIVRHHKGTSRELMLFLAPLCNAAGKIANIRLGEPFHIERWPRRRLLRTLKRLELLPDWEILLRVEEGNCLARSKRFATVVTADVPIVSPAALETGKFMEGVREQERYYTLLAQKLKLMRLFKTGHVDALSMYWYSDEGGKIEMDAAQGSTRAPHEEPYFIRPDEVGPLSSFLATWHLPFKKSFLQLAFESFEESFRADREHLRFLNLMIALEALFNVGQHDLRFRISRNAAILLGRDEEDVEVVFDHMREYYDKRSQLVHTGKFDQISGSDVWMLAYYVREAIKAIASSGLDKDDVSRHLTTGGFREPYLKRQLPARRGGSNARKGDR